MKRPMLMVGALFAAGIFVGRFAQPPVLILCGISLGVGVLALAWEQGRATLLWALLPLVGWTNEVARTALLAPDDLRVLFGGRTEQVAVRGRMAGPLSSRIFLRDAEETWRSSAIIDVEAAQTDAGWTPAFGRITAHGPGLLDSNYFAGQEVIVKGVIQQPGGPEAPGLFDARTFYAEEGIYFELRTESTNDWRIVPGEATWLGRAGQRFEGWARAELGRGQPEEDEPLRLLWTLALDWRAPLNPEVEAPFLRAGTYHIFAVDGLRIALLTGICLGLLRTLRLPRAWCGAVALPLVWGYTALTGWPASAVRAGVMMTIVVLGWALRRPVDLLNSLCAAAFVILCWDPRQLFQAGFQLSFVIVGCLAMLLPPARTLVYERLLRGDPFLPGHLRRRWPEWLWGGVKYCIDLLLLSWTAWLASIPLAAYYFHLFTPWSVPANFLVVPLAGLALTACAGSLAFGAWLPGLAVVFNHSAWFWMKSIIVVSQWWANWRPGSFNVAAPPISAVVLYYCALLAVGSGWVFKAPRKRMAWGAVAAAMAAAVVLTMTSGAARVFVLPARGGSVVFLSGERMLVDCGSGIFAENVLKPFLQAQGVNRLRRFSLSSEHVEQIGGEEVMRTNFAIAQADRVGQLHLGERAEGWSVLHPVAGEKHARADDNALAIKGTVGAWTALLLPRMGRAGQDELLRQGTALRSDIVVAGLPAQEEPLSEPLLDAIAPKIIVVADSELPATRRASPELRDRLGRRGAKVFYCRDVGSLTLEPRGKRLRILDAGGGTLGEFND